MPRNHAKGVSTSAYSVACGNAIVHSMNERLLLLLYPTAIRAAEARNERKGEVDSTVKSVAAMLLHSLMEVESLRVLLSECGPCRGLLATKSSPWMCC